MNINAVSQVDMTFYYILGISLFFLVSITAVMIYFVFRYSKKNNPVASDIRGHVGLEVLWTVIPTLIAMSMFYFGWESYLGLRTVPKDALKFEVVGRMFEWEFHYPNGKEADQLIVPKGKAIHLMITSEDVVHSFFLPSHRIKVDAVPKMQTYVWFQADKIGDYTLFCAEYCGTGHADMTSVVKIVDPEQYRLFAKSDADDWEEYQEELEEE